MCNIYVLYIIFIFIYVKYMGRNRVSPRPPKDINSSQGFLRFLWSVLCCRPGAVVVAGILCSSWSIVNRNSVGVGRPIKGNDSPKKNMVYLQDSSIHVSCVMLIKKEMSKSGQPPFN